MDQQAFASFRTELFKRMWTDLAPLEEEIENSEHIPFARVRALLQEMRAFALLIPEQYGGVGLTATQYIPVIAEFAKVHGGIRALVHVHNSFAHALAELGSEEQRQDLLPGAATGELSIAFALTEPGNGTGADLSTTAVAEGDDILINGRKWLITNSDFASHFLVVARTSPERGAGATVVIVPRDAHGLAITPLPELMGCKGGEHGQLDFSNVRVPARNVLPVADGLAAMEQALVISRVLVAASSLGTAEYALDLSVEYAKQRVTFGRPIADRQSVQRYLAEMATDVYALRTMLADVAEKYERGLEIAGEASMVKLFGLEAVARVTDRALLVHGGIGYTRRHPIERLYRDARLNMLEEGTPTIQYLVTARALLAGLDWER